jgi:hypothetical protein
MSIYMDIEHACQTLKHAPQNIDPYELRALLRRTQAVIDALETFLRPVNMTLQQIQIDGYIEHQISLTTNLNSEQLATLLETMANTRD